jgi:hypothetical protein
MNRVDRAKLTGAVSFSPDDSNQLAIGVHHQDLFGAMVTDEEVTVRADPGSSDAKELDPCSGGTIDFIEPPLGRSDTPQIVYFDDLHTGRVTNNDTRRVRRIVCRAPDEWKKPNHGCSQLTSQPGSPILHL